jgi:pSer/pThr/pTyr-binding forkhead associated (FHA) protein
MMSDRNDLLRSTAPLRNGGASSLTGPLPAMLIIQTGPQAGLRCPLDKPLITIGRVDDYDITIDDSRVSRRHAQVRREDFRYILEDLGSTNGTWLNGSRLSEATPLRNGDEVRIADTIMVFNDPSTTVQAEALQPLTLDEARGQALVAGRAVKLTAKEIALLRLLIDHAGQLCPKDLIAQTVWPEYGGDVSDYNVEGLISRLRHKIEPDPDAPIYLHTQRGLGYMLVLAGPPPG